MGKSLFEYAAAHPETQTPPQEQRQIEQEIAGRRDREQTRQEVERLKESISQQIEQGREAQLILYTEISCIGLSSGDTGWSDRLQGQLDSVYGDLQQQSFIADSTAIAQGRLQEIGSAYNERLRKQTETQLKKYAQVERALRDVLKAIDGTEEAPAE